MSFLICSCFVAHILQTCLLFTLFLMIRLSYTVKPPLTWTRTSRIYAEQSGSFLQEAESLIMQSKDELHMRAELLRLTPIPTSAYEELGIKKMKTFYRVDHPIVYYGHRLFDAV